MISGCSFGDDHINAEIKSAITCPGNQTTLIAFIDNIDLTPLMDWLKDEELSKKIKRDNSAVLVKDRSGNTHIITKYDLISAIGAPL